MLLYATIKPITKTTTITTITRWNKWWKRLWQKSLSMRVAVALYRFVVSSSQDITAVTWAAAVACKTYSNQAGPWWIVFPFLLASCIPSSDHIPRRRFRLSAEACALPHFSQQPRRSTVRLYPFVSNCGPTWAKCLRKWQHVLCRCRCFVSLPAEFDREKHRATKRVARE